MEQYIAVVGDPASGFYFHGPFSTFDEAMTWAELNLDGTWWIAELAAPEKEEK